MAIEITEEMRQAVYSADCDSKGHQFLVNELFQSIPIPVDQRNGGDPFKRVLGSRDETQLPSITCGRCNKVWLVMDDPAASYADAEAQLAAKLKDPTQAKPAHLQDVAPHSHP